MALFKVYRGNETNLPAEMTDGWAYFCTDSGNFYIDWDNDGTLTRTQVNADYANNLKYLDGEEYAEISAAELMRRLIALEEDAKNHALKTDIVQSDMAENDPNAKGYVANRTHWKEEVQVPLDIQWDGEIGNRIHVSLGDGSYVKVSDLTFTEEKLKKCIICITVPGTNETVSIVVADFGVDTSTDGCLAIGDFLLAIYDREAVFNSEQIDFPENGLYFLKHPDLCVSCLYSDEVMMPSMVYHKIPDVYFPAHLQFPTATAADAGKKLSFVVDDNGNWVQDLSNTEMGFVFTDRTTGKKYNIYVDNGKLVMEEGVE